MINRKVLDIAIKQIPINEIATLQSVNSNKATVIIAGQVYPNFSLTVGTNWNDYIGSKVLVCFIGQDRSNGVVVGVIL